MPGLVSKPAFLAPAVRIGIAAQKALERALALFNALSARNAPDATAALKINARVFKPGAKPEDPWVAVERLTKEEVDELCPRRDEVQTLFDKAAAKHRRQDYPTAQARGSAIHKEVEREVNKLNDPDFRAEVSVRDSEDAGYGEKGSKRLDIFENTRKKATVCIHDGKTGLKPLTPAEMTELVAAAHSYYEGTERVIITEVRPGE
jgi:hypothetical protein